MKRIVVTGATILALAAAATGLSGCGETSHAPTAAPLAQATAGAGAAAAPSPTPLALESATAQAGSMTIDFGVSGVGEVKAARDADLVFLVQGPVAQVLVKEGDRVKQGDTLVVLDTSTFDQQVAQAEAALTIARAQESALTEAPKSADVSAARAAVAQAEAALNRVKQGAKSQDRQSAQAALEAAKANLQSTKDKLSLSKTQAESQLEQAVQALTAAQARYAQAKYNWDYVQDTGNDPITPNVTSSSGKKSANKLSEGGRQNYAAQFQQAEAALKQAEENVSVAQAAAETARQSEVTGVQAADQQVVQAQAATDKVNADADVADLASAQAALAQAKANQSKLQPSPNNSQKAQAGGAVAQATAALELAKISRSRAELRAPFDGVVSVVNVDPGDSSTVSGGPVVRVVDTSSMHVDVQISDVDIGKVKEGQQAELRLDALPDQVITGTVSYIAPAASVQGTLRTYLVRVTVDKIEGMRAGMSARVDIITTGKE